MKWIYMGFLLSAAIMIGVAGWKYLVQKIRSRSLFLVAVVPVYQLIMAGCFFYVCRDRDEMVIFPGAVLLFFSCTVNAMVLHAVENLLAVRRLQNEIQTLYELRQENRDIHRLGVQYEKERRRIWQDCTSRLDKAYKMLDERKDFGMVRNTLEDAFHQIRTCERTVYCENPIVNSVLVLKKRLAEEKNIPMQIITYVDKDTGVDPLDLCSLFCNLIDNAIEASEKITDREEERSIKISADCRSGFLILRVENRAQQVPEFRNGTCRTSKSTDKELHGLGLKLVRQIVEEYDGRMEIKTAGHKITVTACIRTDRDNIIPSATHP